MTYVYDIFVNFQPVCYDFYEWNKDDKIIHIRKIPIFQIDDFIFQKLLVHDNQIDQDSFQLFKNKTEIFKKKNKISSALFTNLKDIIALLFDKNGNVIKKSYLPFDEENTILKSIRKVDFLNLHLKETKKNTIKLETRLEKETKQFLLNHLWNRNDSELSYLYFECFGKKETNREIIKKRIKLEILKGNEKVRGISYNFLKLICTNS